MFQKALLLLIIGKVNQAQKGETYLRKAIRFIIIRIQDFQTLGENIMINNS